MNKKQIIIDAPEGQVIDMEHFNQTGNVRFIDETTEKIEFPKEWELKEGICYYITDVSSVKEGELEEGNTKDKQNKNILPTKSLAEQMLIFTQLITMRERYREIEKLNNPELGEIDWNNDSQNKYCIANNRNKVHKLSMIAMLFPFSFQLKETRDEFAKNFGDIILQCNDILG